MVVTPDEWYKICLVYDHQVGANNTVYLYINGNVHLAAQEKFEVSRISSSILEEFVVGTDHSQYYRFHGVITEFNMYLRTLNYSELMNFTQNCTTPSNPELFSWDSYFQNSNKSKLDNGIKEIKVILTQLI